MPIDLRSPEMLLSLVTEPNRHVTFLGTGKPGRHPRTRELQQHWQYDLSLDAAHETEVTEPEVLVSWPQEEGIVRRPEEKE